MKVNPLRFDPFSNRLARDIRNNLSRSFLKSLAEKNVSLFLECGAEYLQQHLEPNYEMYVTKKLLKYKKAFAAIEERKLREVLQQASIFWELELYFEMHELLEPEWKQAEGRRRRALQGLIRAAGMKVHTENNNYKAAASMGSKALADLQKYGDELEGFGSFAEVLADLRQPSRSFGSGHNS
jgi:hypothetical protein